MKKERRQLRLIVRLACLFAAIVLLWPISGWIEGSRLFPQLSPFVAICATIAGRTIGVGLGIGWILAAMVIFRPRWFCRYLCPAGLLFEESARIGLRKTSWWTRCPAVGRYIALITAIGAIVGYPLLLWLDPLSIFGSALTAFTAKTAASKILAGALLGILVILSATSGSLWCSRLCPLGGTQDLLGRVKSLFSETFTHNVPKNAQSHNARTDTLLVRRSFILFTAGIGIAIWGKASGAALLLRKRLQVSAFGAVIVSGPVLQASFTRILGRPEWQDCWHQLFAMNRGIVLRVVVPVCRFVQAEP
jgi:hypothetical protein